MAIALATTLWAVPQLPAQARHRGPPEYFRALRSREDRGNLSRVILKNGVTLIIEEHPVAPLAALVSCLGTGVRGPALETSRRLALWYRRQSPQVRALRQLGSLVRVESHPECLLVAATVPAQSLPQALKIEAALFQAGPAGLPAQVPASDGQAAPAPPGERLLSGLGNMLTSSLGPPQGIEEFQASYFHPQNLVVAVSGNVRRERVLKKAVRLYSHWPAARPPAALSLEPPAPAPFHYRHDRSGRGPALVGLAFRGPAWGEKGYLELRLLDYLLGRGRGALLKEEMERPGGVLLHLETRLWPLGEGSVFAILLEPVPGEVDAAISGVVARLERLRASGPAPAELKRAKAMLVRDHYRDLEQLVNRALLLARHQVIGSYRERDRWPREVAKIQASQIAGVLKSYLGQDHMSVYELFPPEAEPRTFTEDAFRETMELLVRATALPPRPALDEGSAQEAFQPPKVQPVFAPVPIRRTSILRGPEIYLQEDHTTPLVEMGWFFPGGRLDESPRNAGITELMLRSWIGSAPSEEEGLWRQMEEWGVGVEAVNEPDFFGIYLVLFSRDLERVLGKVVPWIRNPRISPARVDWEKKRLLGRVRGGPRSSLEAALALLPPRHPYRLVRWGTESSLAAIQPDQVQEWLRKEVVRVHPWIVMWGNFSGTSFLTGEVSALSDASYARRRPAGRKPFGLAFHRRGVGARGEELDVFNGPPVGSRDEAILRVLESAVEQGALLTQPKASSVPPRVEHSSGLAGGFIWVSSRPLGERRLWARRLGELATVPIRDIRYPAAQVGAITHLLVRQREGRAFLLELTRRVMAGRRMNYVERELGRIPRIRREDIMRAAARYLVVARKAKEKEGRP